MNGSPGVLVFDFNSALPTISTEASKLGLSGQQQGKRGEGGFYLPRRMGAARMAVLTLDNTKAKKKTVQPQRIIDIA